MLLYVWKIAIWHTYQPDSPRTTFHWNRKYLWTSSHPAKAVSCFAFISLCKKNILTELALTIINCCIYLETSNALHCTCVWSVVKLLLNLNTNQNIAHWFEIIKTDMKNHCSMLNQWMLNTSKWSKTTLTLGPETTYAVKIELLLGLLICEN